MTRQCPNLKIVVAAAVNMRDAYEKRKLKSEKQKNDKEAAKLLPKISIEHVDKQRLEPLAPMQAVRMFIEKVTINLDSKRLNAEEKANFYREYIAFIVADFRPPLDRTTSM